MGFWTRVLGNADELGRIDARAAGTPLPRSGWKIRSDAGHLSVLGADPREAAGALHLALDAVESLGFDPLCEITVDDIDFAYYGGPEGFTSERISALFRLEDHSGRPLFPRVCTFDPQFVDSHDAYARLLDRLAEAAGTRERFTEVHCNLHFGPDFARHPVGELRYVCAGEHVEHDVAVEGDFADPDVVRRLFEDTTPAGYQRVATKDLSVHAWVDEDHAETLRRILAAEDAAAATPLALTLAERRRYPGWRPEKG